MKPSTDHKSQEPPSLDQCTWTLPLDPPQDQAETHRVKLPVDLTFILVHITYSWLHRQRLQVLHSSSQPTAVWALVLPFCFLASVVWGIKVWISAEVWVTTALPTQSSLHPRQYNRKRVSVHLRKEKRGRFQVIIKKPGVGPELASDSEWDQWACLGYR
jgi:hypothetical protein